jgi:hypothetical protein
MQRVPSQLIGNFLMLRPPRDLAARKTDGSPRMRQDSPKAAIAMPKKTIRVRESSMRY